MRRILRNGALALSIAAAAVIASAPASAKSIQKDGYFGGTWAPIGPRDNRHVQRYHRKYGYPNRYGYYAPRGSYYGPGYYGGPGYYAPRGGVSFGVTVR